MIDLNTISNGTIVTYDDNVYAYRYREHKTKYGSVWYHGLFNTSNRTMSGDADYIIDDDSKRDPFLDREENHISSEYIYEKKSKIILDVGVDNGKYTIQQDEKGNLKALRYGEEWRDCCGDNLIYHLAAEVEDLRDRIEMAKQCVSYNRCCSSCDDTYKILDNS